MSGLVSIRRQSTAFWNLYSPDETCNFYLFEILEKFKASFSICLKSKALPKRSNIVHQTFVEVCVTSNVWSFGYGIKHGLTSRIRSAMFLKHLMLISTKIRLTSNVLRCDHNRPTFFLTRKILDVWKILFNRLAWVRYKHCLTLWPRHKTWFDKQNSLSNVFEKLETFHACLKETLCDKQCFLMWLNGQTLRLFDKQRLNVWQTMFDRLASSVGSFSLLSLLQLLLEEVTKQHLIVGGGLLLVIGAFDSRSISPEYFVLD